MEIYAVEEGGAPELLQCGGCGGADLEPLPPGGGGTGAASWSLMTRFSAQCAGCGRETHLSWAGRLRFRFARRESGAARAT
ncbi:MAG: hypothetical protein AABZ64_02300 [Nitrospinota bacterium]